MPTRRYRTLLVLLILAAAAVLRLANLRHSPAWYHDECTYVEQTASLMHGSFQWEAVEHTFLPRLPLLHVLIMPFFALFGKDILWVRLVSALSGIATAWLIYRIAREAGGSFAALAATLFYALFFYPVLISRWGFSYNLDGAFGAANLYFLQRFGRAPERTRYLILATGAAALGLMVDPVMISRAILLGAAAFLFARPKTALGAVALCLGPVTTYLAFLFMAHRAIFLEDVCVILDQRVIPHPPHEFLKAVGQYFVGLGPWMIAAAAGMFLCLPNRRAARLILWAFVLDLAVLLKANGPDASILYRTGIILMPALSVGLGFAALAAGRRVEGMLGLRANGILAGAGRIVVVTAAILSLLLPSASGVFRQFTYNYNDACLFSIDEAGRLARWANARLKSDDLVVSSHINWMLNCRTASPMLVELVDHGAHSPIYFEGLRRRLVYPCSLSDARWAIVDETFPGLMSHYHFDATMREIQQSWKLIHSEGTFLVYENPKPFPPLNPSPSPRSGS